GSSSSLSCRKTRPWCGARCSSRAATPRAAAPSSRSRRNQRPLRMSVRRLAPPELQPDAFAFTADNLAWARKQIAKYPEGRQQSAVIPILWRAQEQNNGWLSQKAIEAVATLLGMAYIRVLEVAT